MIDQSMTVAEIIRTHPRARAVLARYGLDACCGGKHPLEMACRAHKVSIDEVLAALREAIDAPVVIDASMCVRDIIANYPATHAVFERHGLMGCGGSAGPVEPLDWFAKVHHVDLPQLLTDLHAAARGEGVPDAPGGALTPTDLAHENLYRRFLKAALLFTFTGGTVLGAWALVVMALRGRLGGFGHGLLQVHGHYQLFGWVGLFVVGIAYHILPRLTGVPLPSYRLASLSFALMVAGTLLRTAQALDPSALRSTLLIGGGLMELAGCLIFTAMAVRILLRQAGRVIVYQWYLAIGCAWLLVAALLNLGHAAWLAMRGVTEVPAFLNLPYLTVFLLGFVTCWILGVSLRTLPVFMGLPSRPRAAAWLLAPLTVAVGLLALGEAVWLAGGSPIARVVFGLGGIGVAACLALFTGALGILRRTGGPAEAGLDRGYEKFLRLGYVWLLIAAAMLFSFSVRVIGAHDMPHALVGAYRHALTVGFITTIMVGMAMRIVPVFRGVPLHSPLLLEWTFWLLAIGNVMRVLFQSLSAFAGPAWLRPAGLSGILELAALLLFGINIWKTMNTETADDRAVAGWRPPIASDTRVGDLLDAYPGLLPIFLKNGFTPLANPLLRRTLARGISLAQACRMHGVDLESLLGQLSEAQARQEA